MRTRAGAWLAATWAAVHPSIMGGPQKYSTSRCRELSSGHRRGGQPHHHHTGDRQRAVSELTITTTWHAGSLHTWLSTHGERHRYRERYRERESTHLKDTRQGGTGPLMSTAYLVTGCMRYRWPETRGGGRGRGVLRFTTTVLTQNKQNSGVWGVAECIRLPAGPG